ncbi:MAG: permease-like cell division protein FtsX [Nitrococcus sp.]|nr:permease-like cell division protein FtsX [Nitrococcus sp.]
MKPRRSHGSLRRLFRVWREQHARALFGSLGQFTRSPVSNLMTAGVIGVALALPASFLLLLDNIQTLTAGWQGQPHASLFLKRALDAGEVSRLARQIGARESVTQVRIITPEQGLQELRELSGFRDALTLLQSNPLPPVIEVEPSGTLTPAQVDTLIDALAVLPSVEHIRLDRDWLRRLHAIMQLLQRVTWIVAALLGVTVILVVGNTIRLDIENRRDEIVIVKLIGATDAFVRRPFLYSGLWHGLAGGLLACLLVETGHLLLNAPTSRLAGLYGSRFELTGIGFSGSLTLLGCGAFLGLVGSWLAVGRHLIAIEPR